MSFYEDNRIEIKSTAEVEIMRTAGRMLREILDELGSIIKPGMSTWDLEERARILFKKNNVQPAFLGYQGFPAALCTSINQEVVHGIPSPRRALKSGDLLKVDAGLNYQGFYSDSARTFPIGEVDAEAKRLLETAEQALWKGIEKAVPGNRLFDISSAIQSQAENAGFSVVREYTGHGIGRRLHEPPQIPNFGKPGKGPRLRKGMVFAIEPMVNAGGFETRVLPDEWTVETADGLLSTHFEHTVAILEEGPEVLTAQ